MTALPSQGFSQATGRARDQTINLTKSRLTGYNDPAGVGRRRRAMEIPAPVTAPASRYFSEVPS
jgi:hypothetical protein